MHVSDFMKNVGLYFIISEAHAKNGSITDANSAIKAGAKVIHYSDKKSRKRQVLENAYVLAAICKKNNVLFIVEDYPDIAALVGADGVYLTQSDFSMEHVRRVVGEEKYIGVQFATLREAVYAEEHGANYICLGNPETSCRATLSTMKKMKELLTMPIITLGTFTVAQVEDFLRAGADGIAMAPYLYQEQDLSEMISMMQHESL